jgi:hypothetical protein
VFTVPLVVVFTKFDGQIVQQSADLDDIENDEDKWDLARKKADEAFQAVYLPKVLNSAYPPKAYLQLEGKDGICQFGIENNAV